MPDTLTRRLDQVKPIETTYDGVLFRSRLEARWAVFFDVLKIKWLYEPEGFELSSGRYVPDFYLPDLSRWVEVKPVRIWEYKHEEFACLCRFVLVVGAPGLYPFAWDINGSSSLECYFDRSTLEVKNASKFANSRRFW